jgi:hypothetical protein
MTIPAGAWIIQEIRFISTMLDVKTANRLEKEEVTPFTFEWLETS